MIPIGIASDHAAFPLKQFVKSYLEEKGIEYKDYGAYTGESCDYAVFGQKAANAVASGECERGILCCGTGIGISLAANKTKGIRCVVCSDCFSAKMSREHNDCNMLALGARVVGGELARMIVKIWLETEFAGGRHQRRRDQIMAIEAGEDLTAL
jgi:ribose 5-phosphate isomerase B